jgi:hypothetical protein
MDDHQPLRENIGSQGKNHGRNAEIGYSDSVNQAGKKTAGNTERDRKRYSRLPPAARGRRHHAADRHDPRNRKIDLAQKNDQHQSRRDDPEK